MLDALWRPSEYQCLPGVSRHAGRFAGAEQEGGGVRDAGGDGVELPHQRDFDFCAEELFLSRPAQGISDFAVRQAAGGAWIYRNSGSGCDEKKIGITRVHLEEDAGKSLHEGFADSGEKTAIDLNRTGVPLIEIVSEPDIATPDEAYEYLTRLKEIILYTGVSDCNMEEGSLRCDANVSVRPRGQKEFGTKTEIKNVNSFRFIREALDYEIGRQIDVIESGGKITQETRLYNSHEGKTYSMRSKEQAHDYRYFPEPDLLPLVVNESGRRRCESRCRNCRKPDAGAW